MIYEGIVLAMMGMLMAKFPKKFGMPNHKPCDNTIVIAMGCFVVVVGIVILLMDVLV